MALDRLGHAHGELFVHLEDFATDMIRHPLHLLAAVWVLLLTFVLSLAQQTAQRTSMDASALEIHLRLFMAIHYLLWIDDGVKSREHVLTLTAAISLLRHHSHLSMLPK